MKRLLIAVAFLGTFALVACFEIFIKQGIAEDDLIKKYTMMYESYEGISIKGELVDSTKAQRVVRKFEANFPRTVVGGLPRFEYRFLEENPGEPHLTDKYIAMETFGMVEGVWLRFERRLVSVPTPSERLSSLIMDCGGPSLQCALLDSAIFGGIDGLHPRFYFGVPTNKIQMKVESVGKETFLGIDCDRIRVTLDDGSTSSWLVALKPSFQVMKFIDTTSNETLRKAYGSREVLSAKIFGNLLLCDKVRVKAGSGDLLVTINQVEPMQKKHVGIYDYNQLTGLTFQGDYAIATHKGSPRQPLPKPEGKQASGKPNAESFYKDITYIPYSENESKLIREYIVSKASERHRQGDWLRSVFWISVCLGGMLLIRVYYFKRRSLSKP